jgi:glycosyltransferase involved in cell wall biosynthesis
MAAKLREPSEREHFERSVAPLLGDGVEYVGEVGGRDKVELLASARCLLHPVTWPEPFGIAMIEALACGTPVVATPEGSISELIRDGVTGFVRPTDAGLAEALRCSGELDRAACRAVASNEFSNDRMVADHVALYERVLADHPSSSAA